jgi:PilZ domain-containing protein
MAQRTKRANGKELTAADLRGGSMAWAERRGVQRMSCQREVEILSTRAARGEGFRAVGLHDCSAHGISLVSAEPMEPGEQFIVKLRAESPSLVTYTVRHCTPAGDGQHYNIGAALTAFIGPPGDSLALDALLPAKGTAARQAKTPAATTSRRTPAKSPRS